MKIRFDPFQVDRLYVSVLEKFQSYLWIYTQHLFLSNLERDSKLLKMNLKYGVPLRDFSVLLENGIVCQFSLVPLNYADLIHEVREDSPDFVTIANKRILYNLVSDLCMHYILLQAKQKVYSRFITFFFLLYYTMNLIFLKIFNTARIRCNFRETRKFQNNCYNL